MLSLVLVCTEASNEMSPSLREVSLDGLAGAVASNELSPSLREVSSDGLALLVLFSLSFSPIASASPLKVRTSSRAPLSFEGQTGTISRVSLQ